MTTTVRRAAAFAAVGTASLVVPAVGRVASGASATIAGTAPFVLVAVLALYVFEDGVVFELFARPGDRQDRRLYGLAGFSLSIAGLALLATRFGLPMPVFAAAVCILAYGNLAEHLARTVVADEVLVTVGFVTGGFVAGIASQLAAIELAPAVAASAFPVPTLVFFAASGALLASLLRAVLFARDDPLVMLSIGLLLWLFADLGIDTSTTQIALALGVVAGLGLVSYALDTASLPGMLTGVFLGLLTIVLGDWGWFAILISFFAIGGLSTKFRYDEKQTRGVAEENEGARGSGNVLANSITAMAAVIGWAASPTHLPVPPVLFLFAFASAVAASMSDTLSSEIGGLYDDPRLITSFERVAPGTDGAVTWQGEAAGLAGAAIVATIAYVGFDAVTPVGALVVLGAGFLGMTTDSLLGATLEGRWFGNQGVNFAATVVAALAGGVLAVLVNVT